ncbi:BamA/TamA family outer membrane protein [Vibrio parahaemolyticus]|uniref:BamA/TamA family outer membrane protein n=1 Tax=Vibrio mediterranei TaxID=689 RepID=UPI004067E736
MQSKKILNILALASCVFSAMSTASTSSFIDEVDNRFDMGHFIADNSVGFLPIPIIITEPAVGYGGGLVGLFMHETDEQKQERKAKALASIDGGAQLMPASITAVGAAGTKNGSWFAFAGHRHSWLNDSIRYIGGAGIGRVNLDIYQDINFDGIGLLPPANTTLSFDTQTSGVAMLQKVQFRVANTPLMLGLKQFASYSEVKSDNAIADKLLALSLGKDTTISGLGLLAEYDTRDNLFYPKSGYKVAADYMVYDKKLGSDANYRKLGVDGEVFIPLADKWTLAFAGNYQQLDSDELALSPTTQPYVKLRGVSSYRYQGDQVMTAQSQVVYDIDHRWKVSAFYGIGEAKEDSQISKDNRVDAYGAGFRYQLARRYGLFMGMDFAKSKDEGTFYITLGSGF